MSLAHSTDSGQPSGAPAARSPQWLACIYTCAEHSPWLARFHHSSIGRFLRERPGTRIVDVLAEPSPPRPGRIEGHSLLASAEERYDALSIKTLRMVQTAVAQASFDALLKIDVTTVMTRMDGPEYAERVPIDLEALEDFLRGVDSEKDYQGLMLHAAAAREGAENWARKKGGAIDYGAVFGDGPMPPFFSGKCYLLSRRFAEFIAREGEPYAEEQRRLFLGSEDVMIGRLHQAFVAEVMT